MRKSLFNEKKFKNLQDALIFICKRQPGKIKYLLRDTNDLSMTLFECSESECPSHIIYKVQRNIYNQFYFQIHHFNQTHQHSQNKMMNQNRRNQKQVKSNWQLTTMKILEYFKGQLRTMKISHEFRDFLSNFQCVGNNKINLLYQLPQIVKSKNISTIFRVGYKTIDERKKIHLFFIQVWILGQLISQVKYLHCVKTIKPFEYLYTIFLLYVLLNGSRNSIVELDTQLYQNIQLRKIYNPLLLEFFDSVHQNLFNAKLKKSERTSQIEEQKSDIFYQSCSSNSLLEDQQKIALIFLKMEVIDSKSIKNKILALEMKYNEIKINEPEWRANEQKLSLLRKFNSLMRKEQQKRRSNQRRKFEKQTDFKQLPDNKLIIIEEYDEIDRVKHEKQRKEVQKYIKVRNIQCLNQKLKEYQQEKQVMDLIDLQENINPLKRSSSVKQDEELFECLNINRGSKKIQINENQQSDSLEIILFNTKISNSSLKFQKHEKIGKGKSINEVIFNRMEKQMDLSKKSSEIQDQFDSINNDQGDI